jgi:alkanesulfonate monooxygenase SsuD/methylene tetrahydromethanopterin reductase-like flavin-dependent oxidoreductase (luciferase family)
MIAISLMIEGQNGLNWPRWRRLVSEAEELGFAGLYRSDHFLSGGRMVLGLGAGWQEREHLAFGHTLGDLDTRMRRFSEGLELVTRLLRSDEPVTFEGQFFRLHDAVLLPRPQRPGGPRILIGGTGPKRTLPLVARFADVWNSLFMSPAEYQQRQATLDDLLLATGRQPGDVRRTVMCGSYFARDAAELERLLAFRSQRPELAGKSLTDVADTLAARGFLTGTPDDILRQIHAYEDAGAQEMMVQWLDLDDAQRLRAFARDVVARLR